MTIYMNPELYNPDGSVDQLVADGDTIVLMDTYSTDYTTVFDGATFAYSPTITKSAFNGGFKADVEAKTNQSSTESGAIINYAILDTVNSKILHIGESSGVEITAGNPFNIPAFSVKFPAAIAS